MAFMRWTEAMSVGSPELNADHKQLVYLINRLAKAPDSEAPEEVVRQALFSLVRYAELHFAREEQVLTACGYPELDVHKEEHRSFVSDVTEFAQHFDRNPEGGARKVREELLGFLKEWLNHHILIEDMAYRPFVEGKDAEVKQALQATRGVELAWGG